MTLEELKRELCRRKALIVHFSHDAEMREGLHFPTDLLQVLSGGNDWALSCSVLTPGHQMAVVGSVGVILEPQSTEDILKIYHDDAGSWSAGTSYDAAGELLSLEAIDRSLTQVEPGKYNEWLVRGAKRVGIFIVNPSNIWVRTKVPLDGPYGCEETHAPRHTDLAKIREIFAGQPLWTMDSSGPVSI